MGISPGARAASPPLRGLSLAEDPFTRELERASSRVGHARWETPRSWGRHAWGRHASTWNHERRSGAKVAQ